MTKDRPALRPFEFDPADGTSVIEEVAVEQALADADPELVVRPQPPKRSWTGRLLGLVHIQRLLREPPSELVAGLLDKETTYLRDDATIQEVAAHVAYYNLTAAPVVDDEGRLLGVVTVDDLLDHMLPENWRDERRSTLGPKGPVRR